MISSKSHKSYVGQTSRYLKTRFQEHTRYIKNNDPRSSYALHILNCRYEYGNINDTMTLLKHVNKPSLLLPYNRCSYSHFTTVMSLSMSNRPANITPCMNSSGQKHLTSQTSKTPYQQPPPTVSSPYSCLSTGHQDSYRGKITQNIAFSVDLTVIL